MIRYDRSSPRGYAMLVFVGLMAIITVITAIVVSAARADRSASRSLLTATEERTSTSTALAEYYAALSGLTPEEQSYLLQSCVPGSTVDLDALGRTPTDLTGPERIPDGVPDITSAGQLCSRWLTPDLAECPEGEPTQVCFFLSTFRESLGAGTASASSLNVTIVDVTSRTRCDRSGENCQYTRYQQRLRRSQFFDFIFYNQYTTLDPQRYADIGLDPEEFESLCGDRYGSRPTSFSPEEVLEQELPEEYLDGEGDTRLPREEADAENRCLDVAYYGRDDRQDDINGPLYTNDDFISVCGRPVFQGTVYVSGQGLSPNIYRSTQEEDPGCGTADPDFRGRGLSDQSDLELPDYTSALNEIKDLDETTEVGFGPNDETTIVLEGDKLTYRSRDDFSGTSKTVDLDAGPIYSSGNIRISGNVKGKLSIFAEKDITVIDDIYYGDPDVEDDNSNKTDVLALNAGGSIIIEEPEDPAEDRELSAVLVALEGAVYVKGWSDGNWTNPTDASLAPDDVPTLQFFGAMASKYQNVFGGYDSVEGFLVGGYLKDFEFDDRLRQNTITAPYLISPSETTWTRLDTAEVALCRGTNPAPDACS